MPEYTADDIERSVLDPLFYRYEKAIRSCARLEGELAKVKQECARLAAVESKLNYQTVREQDLRKRMDVIRAGDPKLTALYEAANALLLQVSPTSNLAKRRVAIGDAAKRLRAAMADAVQHIDLIPF